MELNRREKGNESIWVSGRWAPGLIAIIACTSLEIVVENIHLFQRYSASLSV